MKNLTDKTMVYARAEAHASLLESVAAMMELDGIGLAPEQGHVHHLRRMAGAIRAQAALGRLAQSYTGGRYLSDPTSFPGENGMDKATAISDAAWH
jgi:hypothetical protein